ncbi:MAG: hypothetical protein E2O68_09815 [Deltaproteobacteria bacterium]|nr:MAG: hypothetical protein E2O68_09815 [Deltaproteobacteria bacterium]
MVKIILFLILFSFNSFGQRPKWITHVGSSCPKTEICAVGVGADLNQATTRGRDELAKIFKVKIASDTFIKTRSETLGFEGEVFEVSEKNVSELTDVALKGSYLKNSFQDGSKIFALIALNRESGARIIKGEIKVLDEKIENLYREGKRGSIFKAIALFSPREKLEAKHDFLVERKITPIVSLKSVLKKRDQFLKKKVSILFKTKVPKEIKDYFTSLLLKMGYRVVTSKTSKYNYSVDLYLDWEEEYLKVPGFVKYRFNIKLYSYNLVRIKIGTLMETTMEKGRNFNQCYRRAKDKFKKYLLQNINDINLD